MWNFALIPFLRYIKLAITGAIFGYIRDSVYAWADNVFVVLSIVSGQPARATHISVAFPVCNEPLQEFKDFFLIRVEKVTLWAPGASSRFQKVSQFHSLLSKQPSYIRNCFKIHNQANNHIFRDSDESLPRSEPARNQFLAFLANRMSVSIRSPTTRQDSFERCSRSSAISAISVSGLPKTRSGGRPTAVITGATTLPAPG